MFGLAHLVYETEQNVSEEPGSKLRLAYETTAFRRNRLRISSSINRTQELGSKLRLAYETEHSVSEEPGSKLRLA